MTATAAPPGQACELRCLGTVTLTSRGGRVAPRTRKQMALLLYLARRPGKAFARDELIELLWSEDDAKGARHSLSQAASLINKAMGGEVLRSVGNDRLVLAAGAVWLDVAEFERLVTDGRHDEALALWRGQLFEGTWIRRAPHFEQWLGAERDRLHRIFRRIAHGRLEDLRNSGNHVAMREEAERLLELDPLDEKAMLVHLEALTLMDDRSLALRRYRDFEKRLRRELDAEPSSALKNWIKRHRRGDGDAGFGRYTPMPRISEVTVLPTPQPLFGRTEEFAQLWTAWEQAQQGKGSFIILEGEAGIGKTALATKLVNQAHVAGGSVCYVKCYRTEKSVPFAPVTALIRQLSRLPGFVALDPVWIGELTRLVPELRERFPNAPQPMAVDDAARHRLSDATVQAALAVADELPLMIVVDDLQDADEGSLAALHYLSRHRDAGVLVLGMHKPTQHTSEYERVFLETTRVGGLAQSLRLVGLLEPDVERLVQHVAASRGEQMSVASISAVVAASNGNPLHAIETVISTHTGMGVAATPTKPISRAPTSFDESATKRFGELSHAATLVGIALAIAGHPLAEYELASVTQLRPADLAEALMALESCHFISRAGPRIGFAHERYATTLESSVSSAERTTTHLRLGQLLSRAAANNPAMRIEAARHLEAGGRRDYALRQATSAVRFAGFLGAVRSKAEALELAIRVRASRPGDDVVALGQCYLELSEFVRLRELCQTTKGHSQVSPATIRDLEYLEVAADVETGHGSMLGLQDRLGGIVSDGQQFLQSRAAKVLLARVADKTGRRDIAKSCARELRAAGRRDRYSLFATAYVWCKHYSPMRAIPLLRLALHDAQGANDWATERLCRDGLGIALKQAGLYHESLYQFAYSLALARKTMNPIDEARCLQNRAVTEMALGDKDAALRTLTEAFDLRHDSAFSRTYIVFNRAVLWLFEKDYGQAFSLFRKARDHADEMALRWLVTECTAGMALASLRLGSPGDFGQLASDVVERSRSGRMGGWIVPSTVAWWLALDGNDSTSALLTVGRARRSLARQDVAHYMSASLESIWLGEYIHGRRLIADRENLAKEASKIGARGVLTACDV